MLSRGPIEDLSFLSGLSSLASLNVGWNQVSDLKPLSSLTNLTELYLFANNITDVAPLEGKGVWVY